MTKAVHDYCNIAGASAPDNPDKPCFYAHDGSTCSLVRVYGTSTIMSEENAIDAAKHFMTAISAQMKKKGHALTITYERSNNIDEDVDRLLVPLEENSSRKGLSMQAGIDELSDILKGSIAAERILIAVWTFRDAAVGQQFSEDVQLRKRTIGRLPLSRGIQDPNGPYESLQANHFAFVGSVVNTLTGEGFRAEMMGQEFNGRQDLAEVRRSLLFHETPQDWSPKTQSDVRYPRVKETKSNDVSDLFATTLDRQIMTSAAKATTDLRSVSMGGRTYAVAYLSEFPQHMTAFRRLLTNVLGSTARRDDLPFRISFHIEGGAKIPMFEQVLATILSIFSPEAKRKKLAFDGLEALMKADQTTVLNCRIMATTWIEPTEQALLLEDRRSRLVRALSSWQSPIVKDSAVDPMRLLVETAPGMVGIAKTGSAFMVPAGELGYSLPFHSESPIEEEGETIFTTLDDKPFPFKAHSPLQDSWFSLIFAPPGSGKSVLMNSMNMDFAAFYGAATLPFIGQIDIGESSKGFIDTLKAALPSDRRDEVTFITMRNEMDAKEYYCNPFDIGLGRRTPLKREQNFTQNFLKAMCGVSDAGLDALMETVVQGLYTRFSDISVSSQEKIYQPDRDHLIDEAIAREKIAVHDSLSWWSLVDTFMRKGQHALAERSQRYAVPVMTDVIAQLSNPEVQRRHTEALCNQVRTQVESSINAFPCFSNETALDIGAARIVSIDLNPVIIRTPTSESDNRSNMLFFLMARELFVKKVSGDDSELLSMKLPDEPSIKKTYIDYWRDRYREIAQTRKRFCFDEFHVTGSSPIMANQIDQDVRQGRKWGFEIVLASQKILDFEKYVDLASNFFILKSDSGSDRDNIQRILDVSDAVINQIRTHVKGPIPGVGSIFLLGRRLRGLDSWLLARNKIGPVRIWSLSTTMEDRELRQELYNRTGDVNEALQILATKFPSGSCVRYWRQIAPTLDGNDNVAAHIAAQLLNEHILADGA